MDNSTILFATTNPGKIREATQVLAELGLTVQPLDEGQNLPEAVEDGESFMANAEKKALHYHRLTGKRVLADDSGLEVDALGGMPGVQSARYAGPQRDDLANNARLVKALAAVPVSERTARFVCAVAVADGGRIMARANGVLDGVIVEEPRGSNGFGYDPHFFVPELGLTTAQMPPAQKNRISHRGRAMRAMAASLADILQRK